ncbi:hypothetical protein GCG54_00015366 [Colletotrichum gloeosporioides]|uniref:Uncharacterized protein n=1 Tax=Colletotrichum gloeosporioides TaxID=474922 RepID=A0A8H4CQ29_COLGL|nr:uncharacterized protein GCG54_00015366 [Colletotrichum gloeosporioides]KAF3807983.1 hypothetical protein GCG54_00015366 [Colletotrichum gloeosporioides]
MVNNPTISAGVVGTSKLSVVAMTILPIDPANRKFPTPGIASSYTEASIISSDHVIPRLAFGIKSDKSWEIENAAIPPRAHSYSERSSSRQPDMMGGDCGFGYKVAPGVGLVADTSVSRKSK